MTDPKREVIYDRVLEYFNQDKSKTALWFDTPNPLLGNFSPNMMIGTGKSYLLVKQFPYLEDLA